MGSGDRRAVCRTCGADVAPAIVLPGGSTIYEDPESRTYGVYPISWPATVNVTLGVSCCRTCSPHRFKFTVTTPPATEPADE